MENTKITNPDAKRFYTAFMQNRTINKDFYKLVSEENFDFRLVDTNETKSDSIRESLAHLINVQKTYMMAIKTGFLEFGLHYDKNLKLKSKTDLLTELSKAESDLKRLLSKEKNCSKLISVPWSNEKINAITMLWSLDSHEILHTGWNLAFMDVLGIKRFSSLKQMWG